MSSTAPSAHHLPSSDPWTRLIRVEGTPGVSMARLTRARAAALSRSLTGEAGRARGLDPVTALGGVESVAAGARRRPYRPLRDVRRLVEVYTALRGEDFPRAGLLSGRTERSEVVARRREAVEPLVAALDLLASGYGERPAEGYLRDRLSGVPHEWARRRFADADVRR